MTEIVRVNAAVLNRMPLPVLDAEGDKNARGSLLVIGGGAAVPGAPVLTGYAGLRAGAGKLQIATVEANALMLGLAVPEARVHALPPTLAGELSKLGASDIRKHLKDCDAVVIGTGMIDSSAAGAFTAELLKQNASPIVIDAGALTGLRDHPDLHDLAGRAILTPHAGELASLLDEDIQGIEAHHATYASRAAQRFNAVMVLKGASTHIAEPSGAVFELRTKCPGLATSGSGDVLAGIIGGLLARGADCLTAALWGASAHARAGEMLSQSIATVGFVAREIVDAVPAAIGALHAN